MWFYPEIYISNVYGSDHLYHIFGVSGYHYFYTLEICSFETRCLWIYREIDTVISQMLKNEELKPSPYEKDDLWGKIYGRLVRLSYL